MLDFSLDNEVNTGLGSTLKISLVWSSTLMYTEQYIAYKLFAKQQEKATAVPELLP